MEPRPVTQDDFRSVPEETSGEELVRPDGELGAAADTQLLEDGVQIDLDGPFGDPELLRDLAVAHALANEADQLAFTRRKRRGFALTKRLGELFGPAGQFRVDPAAPAADAFQALEQIGRVRILEHHALDLERLRLEERAVVDCGREQDDPGLAAV